MAPNGPTTEPFSILDEAKAIIYGDREESYGDPTKNLSNIGKIWGGILGIEVTPELVALCMIGVKLARQAHKSKHDNLVDICGYAALIERVEDSI